MRPEKILSYKTYDAIGHLSGSRMGSGDHHIDDKQEKNLTEQLPNQQSLVIVQEKLDGTNVSIVRHQGKIRTITRNGYDCESSNQEQHRMFHAWVMERLDLFNDLNEGDRLVGEWLALAHGTIYKDIKIPFVVFDAWVNGERASFYALLLICSLTKMITPSLIHMGGSCSISRAERLISKSIPCYDYEGFVWRLEENFKVKTVAKYVKPTKVDGLYLPDHTNKTEGYLENFEFKWNWRP